MESLSAIMNALPLLVMVLLAVLGYRLLKIKGHSQWTYLLLLISSTPLFWFIFGLTKSKEPTPTTKLWSNVALLWGIISLLLIIYSQETLQKRRSLTQAKVNEVIWTTERVSLLKSMYTNFFTNVGISSASIEKVVDCMVEKTVDRFPNGIDLTRTTPTIDSIMNKIGKDCGEIWLRDSGVIMKWTPFIESQLILNLKKNMVKLNLDSQKMDDIANCILKKLKASYPNGMDSNNKSQDAWENEMASLMLECYESET